MWYMYYPELFEGKEVLTNEWHIRKSSHMKKKLEKKIGK